MTSTPFGFPISGNAVRSLLIRSAGPDDQWILRDIETLTDESSTSLGELWRRSKAGPITLSTRELAVALEKASQVIALDIHIKGNPSFKVSIEDGITVECTLWNSAAR